MFTVPKTLLATGLYYTGHLFQNSFYHVYTIEVFLFHNSHILVRIQCILDSVFWQCILKFLATCQNLWQGQILLVYRYDRRVDFVKKIEWGFQAYID